MVLADLLLGWVLYRIFGGTKPAPVAPPPQISPTPSTTTAPVSTPSPPTQATTPAALLPAPATRPEPTFPVSQEVPTPAPTTAAAPGKKRAVEVWQVKRGLQSMIVGLGARDIPGTATTAATLTSLEQSFPSGWEACKSVSAQEIATAKALLPRWRKGAVIFMGPGTMAARRAYRMTEHPAASSQPAVIPVSTAVTPAPKPEPPQPPPPPVEVPISAPIPTPTPMVVPVSYTAPVATPAPIVAPPAVPAVPTMQVTAVRRGEGLAQIAKRLGQPESRDSVLAIREVNVPQGPDASWKKTDLMKGGLAKLGRTGGIQPGDKLFVPPQWGIIDVSRL